MGKIIAPFTVEQVVLLEIWQTSRGFHSFTCCSHNNCERRKQPNEGALIPSTDGWVCPCGEWKQNWCHDYMCTSPELPRIEDRLQYEIAKEQLESMRNTYGDLLASSLLNLRNEKDQRLSIMMSIANKWKTRIDEYENENGQVAL